MKIQFKEYIDIQQIVNQFSNNILDKFDTSLLKSLVLHKTHPKFPQLNQPNYILLEMQVQLEHCNYIRTMHGGAVGTLVDLAGTLVILKNDKNQRISTTVQLQTNFFRAAIYEQKIFILAKTDKIGKSLGNATVEIMDQNLTALYNGTIIKHLTNKKINFTPKLQLNYNSMLNQSFGIKDLKSQLIRTKGYFDWYINIKQLYYYLEISKVNKDDSILILGCGNSKLNNELSKKDISQVCIQKMKTASDKLKYISEWITCDGSSLPFKNKSFDFCIEKGTIDALQCGEDQSLSIDIMNEMIRVTDKKIFFITHGNAIKRNFLFKDLNLKVQYCKQPLSNEADLINCMRSMYPDKTLKEIMKDKDCLIEALVQCCIKRQKRIKIKEVNANGNKKPSILNRRYP